MSETKKAILVVLLSIVCLATLCAWLLPREATTAVWTMRVGLTLALTVNLGLTIWAFRRRDRVPDFLRRLPAHVRGRRRIASRSCRRSTKMSLISILPFRTDSHPPVISGSSSRPRQSFSSLPTTSSPESM